MCNQHIPVFIVSVSMLWVELKSIAEKKEYFNHFTAVNIALSVTKQVLFGTLKHTDLILCKLHIICKGVIIKREIVVFHYF